MKPVITGLENLIKKQPYFFKDKKIGLLCNPASVNRNFTHAKDLINKIFPKQLVALFSPQHGFYAEKQDNMIESNNITDSTLKIPVFSLYGDTRIPTNNMLENIDILLVDIQDVGTRVYTFIYTISYCMEKAKEFNKQIVILDRPNPINGTCIQGNILSQQYSSFVGRFPIPMRHGMTVGEISNFFNHNFNINCNLKIIKMLNWKRDMFFDDTKLPWIPPSPNLPTFSSALVYPGQVIWEGTNISEGRGTTQPFEIFGAPFIKIEQILNLPEIKDIPGIILRPVCFEPTSNKWADSVCKGFQIHVIDYKKYNSYETTLKLLQAFIKYYGDDFEWKLPPYEYEFKKLPIDLILGDKNIREKIENLEPIEKITDSWKEELDHYKKIRNQYLLY